MPFDWFGASRWNRLERSLEAIERLLQSINGRVYDANVRLERIHETLRTLLAWKKARWGPRPPERVRLVVKGEVDVDILSFDVILPPWPTGTDVTKGILRVTVGDSESVEREVDVGQTTVSGFQGPQDASVELIFWYLDDAGNRSVNPSTFSGTLVDTIPPPDPGQLGIQVTGETRPS